MFLLGQLCVFWIVIFNPPFPVRWILSDTVVVYKCDRHVAVRRMDLHRPGLGHSESSLESDLVLWRVWVGGWFGGALKMVKISR